MKLTIIITDIFHLYIPPNFVLSDLSISVFFLFVYRYIFPYRRFFIPLYIERLINVFKCKKWLFEEIFLKYNCGQLSNYELITNIASYFSLRIGEEKIIKQDEFDFCIMVIEFLKTSEKLLKNF